MGIEGLAPSAALLLAGVLLDAVFGDPRYWFHPVRLMGRTLSACEKFLRRLGWDGYGGGCALLVLLVLTCVVVPSFVVLPVGVAGHVLLVYTLLALRDLIDHVWAVQRAARRDDLIAVREAIGRMVGRDTAAMDLAACRRAAIESLSENFVDGFLSPIFWYVLLGLPGLLLFKVVSTMDSMVGYKTPRYLRFGWCGARLDDLMNYVPARLAWLILGLSASLFPNLSPTKGWRIGFRQHAVLPGPNPGWSEATMAGLLQRRLIGPIYKDGVLVTAAWIGHSADPEGGKDDDLTRAVWTTVTASFLVVSLAVIAITARNL
jgi:adenosylcobinamide-phosphate synthase